jgi:hypothetical protein
MCVQVQGGYYGSVPCDGRFKLGGFVRNCVCASTRHVRLTVDLHSLLARALHAPFTENQTMLRFDAADKARMLSDVAASKRHLLQDCSRPLAIDGLNCTCTPYARPHIHLRRLKALPDTKHAALAAHAGRI